MLKKQSLRRSGMGWIRSKSAHSVSRLTVETLEDRRLLAGDLLSSYVPAPIYDPFAYQAVTADQMTARAAEHPFVDGELIVAVDTPLGNAATDFYLSSFDWATLTGVNSASPIHTLMTAEQTDNAVSLVRIDVGDTDVLEVMQRMEGAAGVRWAAPNFESTLEDARDLIPNDPQFGAQYHHPLIGNIDAWDVTLGDSSIVVGITDDGVDIQHEDLVSSIWVNAGEIPGNGIDDDGNGFVDDVNGYNFLNNNANPDALPGDNHGTHVAGISSAGTDNGIGVAGTAGGSTILPLKWYDGGAGWTAAVIGATFTYAADNGANIVNTSYNMDGWVGDPTVTAGYQYMLDNGVLHFNSAGNGSQANPPRQAFEQTLLTVSTTSTDAKSGFSNWGTGVDISAPGSDVLSSVPNNGYQNNSGTSMAAPNAAGVAALVWSHNPTWTNYQVAAQVLATADNIDAQNPAFAGLMGAGRVNSHRAVTETVAAPIIEEFTGLPADGAATTDLSIGSFVVKFDQLMDPATANDGANYALVEAGPDGLFDTADDELIPVSPVNNYMIGSNGITMNIDQGTLGLGDYRITLVSGGLANPFGTSLDGNGDGVAGDDVVSFFSIIPPPPVSILPLGSQMYTQNFNDAIGGPTDTDAYVLELDAGQKLTIVVDGTGSLVPTIDIEGPSGNSLASVVGSGNVAVTTIDVASAGNYTVDIGGNGGTDGAYVLSYYLNSGVEGESLGLGDNDVMADAEDLAGSEIAIGTLGADRLGVVGQLPSSAGTPVITENFESGVFGSDWTTSSTSAQGRIQLTGQYGAAGGSLAMIMDVATDSTDNLNEAIWDVDLTGLNSPKLTFYHAEWSDEETALPQTFTGSFNGDGVAISGDGTNWYRVYNPSSQPDGTWIQQSIDLVDAANNAGIPLGQMFIKFQQFDNFSLQTDGRGYDEIAITVPDPSDDWYKFAIADGQSATIAATRYAGGGGVDIELYDAAGNLLQMGVSADNLSDTINQYVDTTTNGVNDEYFVRVAGEDASYSLLVTRDADFDTEANDDIASAQNITPLTAVAGYVSQSSMGVAEPDDFAPGAVLDTAFPGVVLSNNGSGSVFGASASFGAPTGSIVFGPSAGGASGWDLDGNVFRADFDSPVEFVSIDVGSDDASDVGAMQAYDSAGTLLETVTSGSVSTGGSQTIAITRGSAEIAYILAGGVGSDITPLDHLVYSVPGSDDYYRVDAASGQTLDFAGILPAGGPLLFENGLSTTGVSTLGLELLDPAGNVVATDNESISYTTTMSGAHHLRVFSTGGGGEYEIQRGQLGNVTGDFNGDGNWDCADIDQLVIEVASGGSNLAFDMTGDGTINYNDVLDWLDVAGNLNIGTAYRRGDANLDGVIDGEDFIVWNDNKFSASAGWCEADFNADGVTDGEDYIIWKQDAFTLQVADGFQRDRLELDQQAAVRAPAQATTARVAYAELSDSRTATRKLRDDASSEEAIDAVDRVFAGLNAI